MTVHRFLSALASIGVLAWCAIAWPAVVAGDGGDRRVVDRIALPAGFAPEDIATGRGSSFYVGSRVSGAIFKGDVRTGEGEVIVAAGSTPTTGLFVERGRHRGQQRLWAAGARSGALKIHDADSGALLATYQLASSTEGAFISDIFVTSHAAYVTDAFRPLLYVLPLGRRGQLPAPGDVRTVTLTGDVAYQATPSAFNLNGIARVGRMLVSVQTNTGKVFTINPNTGVTRNIPLADAAGQAVTVAGADGFVARGSTLYIARNQAQRIVTVQLDPSAGTARLVADMGGAEFDIPSAVAWSRGSLYAVNARFTTPVTATTAYDVVRVLAFDDDDGGDKDEDKDDDKN